MNWIPYEKYVIRVLVGEGFNPALLVPYGMVLFFYALVVGCFSYEAQRARRILANATSQPGDQRDERKR